MARLSLFLFGSYQTTLEGKSLSRQVAAKGRALLAYLAVEVQAQRREKVAALLWPRLAEAQARQNLSQVLHSLRVSLSSGSDELPVLILRGDEIHLNPDTDVWVDVAEFLALIEACERHLHPLLTTCQACFERMQQAVALYRGDFLADFSLKDSQPFEEWSTLMRERFHRQALRFMHQLAESLEKRGEIERALEYAWRQVESDPLREAGYRQVMRLLAASGRRSEALEQFNNLMLLLQDALGAAPDIETQALYEQILTQVYPTSQILTGEIRLPAALSPFIGRQEELARLQSLLRDPACRLVTIFGPGGVGKTRLALEAARNVARDFPDGTYFIALSAHQPGNPLWPLMVEALRIPLQKQQDPEQQVFDYLREKQALLLFDSFETALQQAGWLSDLLQHAPHLTALVTTRALLEISAEQVFPLSGMQVPAPDESELAGQFSAVQLFQAFARHRQPSFTLDDDTRSGVVRICRAVRGMPLGLLLASAWVDLYTLDEIAEQIDHSLDFLEVSWSDLPARQHSLRATFEYSWNQLSSAEQDILAALAVFQGRFSRQAAGEVSQAPARTLQSLVDKSLVSRLPEGRYQLHDLLHQYAEQKLVGDAEHTREVHARHSRFYLETLEKWGKELKSSRQRGTLEAMDKEVENLRLAWRLAVATRDWQGVAMGLEGMGVYAELRMRFQEGERACRTALEGLAGWEGPGAESLRGWLQAWQARFCRLLGDVERARELRQASQAALARAEADGEDAHWGQALLAYECGSTAGSLGEQVEWLQRSAACYQALGDAWRQAGVLTWAGEIACRLGEQALGMQFLQEAVGLSRVVGEPRQLAGALQISAYQTLIGGQWQAGARLVEEAVNCYRSAGDLGQEALAYLHLGVTLGWTGRFTEAIELLGRALPLLRQVGSRFNVVYGSLGLGVCQMHLGEYEQAGLTLQAAFEAAQKDDYFREMAFCLAMLGCVALVRGQASQAQAALQESVASYRLQDAAGELGTALGGLALAELVLDRREAAHAALQEALSIAVKTHSHFTSMTCWAALLVVLADAGHWEPALEVYGAGQGVPMLANSRWQALVVAPWVAAATDHLPPEVIEAARVRSQGRDIFDIYAELLPEI